MLNALAPADDLGRDDPGIDGAGTVVLAVTGVLDAHHVQAVHLRVIEALRRHRPSRIRLDLHDCPLIDPAGVRGLRLCRADATQLDCRLDLVHACAPVRSTLRTAGFTAPPTP